jgi:23S rRNA pseudouridine2605 synthase
VAFGPFELGDLDDGAVREVATEELRAKLGPEIAAQAEADFEAPLVEHDAPLRHPEVRARDAREPRRMTGKAGTVALRGPRDARPPQGDGERPHPAHKKHQRRDRSGGPRPKYPRPK